MPLKSDLSDIVDKINYLNANDDIARKITRTANEFAEKTFLPLQVH